MTAPEPVIQLPVADAAELTELLQMTDEACALTGDGMTMMVYDFSSNAPEQKMGKVATSICQKEEAAGWLPG